jgi:hypothetical protein
MPAAIANLIAVFILTFLDFYFGLRRPAFWRSLREDATGRGGSL